MKRALVLLVLVVAVGAVAAAATFASGSRRVARAAGGSSANLPAANGASRSSAGLRCRVPRLKGLTVRQVRQRVAKAGCRLRLLGATVKVAAVQTVARQRPRAGRYAGAVTVWVNPLCFRSGLSGPPRGEPIVRTGRTRLVSGLFLVGGPLVPFSSPRCAFRPERPWAGTITVSDQASHSIVATRKVAAGELANFDLAPGAYTINGTFGNATVNAARIHATPQNVNVLAGKVVRQDITADVP